MTVWEKHEAEVVRVDDPERRGRVQVTCVALMADDTEPMPQWVEPAYQWGWFLIPDIGEIIDIEVVAESEDDESPGQSSIDQLDPKWRGARYWGNSEAEEGQGKTTIPEDFTATNYGKRRGFATPGGHVLLFDDSEKGRKVSLTWKKAGAEERSFFSIDPDGSIIMNTQTGHLLYMNSKDGEVSIIDQHGNTYSSNADGMKMISKDSCIIELKGDNVQILAQGAITFSGKNATIGTGEVELGNAATDVAILADVFLNLFANHIHPSGMGPTGAPVVGSGGNTALWEAAKSASVKVSP